MEALQDRATNRAVADQALEPQLLSNLLWAANGQNRADGRRTAPTASNCQEIDVYVVLSTGIYLYDAASHSLKFQKDGDFRKETNRQGFVGGANLLLVANYDKMPRYDQESKEYYSTADAGFVSQNIYLFCASEGLATVVQGMIDRESLSTLLEIINGKVLFSQPVGFPKN